MVDLDCPWCEEQLPVEFDPAAVEQSCPACLTSWSYVEEPLPALAAALAA